MPIRAVFDGGSGGFDPPQEVVDPQKVLQNLWGVDSNPLTTPRFHFLAKPLASIERDVPSALQWMTDVTDWLMKCLSKCLLLSLMVT